MGASGRAAEPAERPGLQPAGSPSPPRLVSKPGATCSVPLNHIHPLWAPDPGPVVLAWGHYLHGPEQLVLDVAAPKLLLHRGPRGRVQHLQPHLRGGAEP